MGNVPFVLKPCGKDYLWGGKRLNDDYEKNIDMFPLAETWECSTHPDGPSTIVSGQYAGKRLDEVLKENPSLLGNKAKEGKLPVLVKLIDASLDLSVQVHPSDEYAFAHENGQFGKTEMWYVLEAEEGAELVYGLSHDLDAKTVKEAIASKDFPTYLNRVKVNKGDIFFIEPGTIHAIGAGIVLAEVQENSNLTYRLYDYDRMDKTGNRRELNIDKALDVANLNKSTNPRQPLRVLKYTKGFASEILCRCRYFEVHRLIVNTEEDDCLKYSVDAESYSVLLCLDGEVVLSFDKEKIMIKKGDCIFVPAKCEELFMSGTAEFIKVRG